jgi:hypothetical protein
VGDCKGHQFIGKDVLSSTIMNMEAPIISYHRSCWGSGRTRCGRGIRGWNLLVQKINMRTICRDYLTKSLLMNIILTLTGLAEGK